MAPVLETFKKASYDGNSTERW